MALSFTKFSWLWRGAKDKEKGPNKEERRDWGLGLRGEPERLNFRSTKRGVGDRKVPSSSRKSKRKHRTEVLVDREYDMVLVPSDGVCLSGSESDDSDWSIGWLEPHPSDFQSFDEVGGDSFAVLVPCYSHDFKEMEVNGVPNDNSDGGKQQYMERWLSSLQSL